MRGASVLQEVLQENPQQPVRVFIVWQAIRASDIKAPGPGILGRVTDARARQFWDPENIFPQELQRRLQSDAAHPKPNCCETDEGVPWDLVVVYPAGAKWESALPAAAFIDGPVYRKKPELQRTLAGK